MISLDDFFTNLAASLAYDLLRAGAARLTTFVSGSPEEQALRGCYQSAFEAMLREVAADLDADRRALVEDILRQFVAQPEVAEGLLALAMEGDEPPLPLLRERFDALEYDRATLPVDFDAALTALTRGLTDALLGAAIQPDSPLYNRVSVVRVAAIHNLLRSLEGHTAGVTAVALSADGRTIVSGLDDRTLRAWDLESGQSRLLFWNDALILSLALSGDDRTLACGDSQGRVWIFEWVR
ncbi:MAG TPA: hypothetical protein PLJ78_11180 [Anaerolineae bacterium]|nr:hypothetical protein [Anaerolineae bacterium]HQK14491.1 hypothetical protein [Anaerolineae bacterium]